MSWSAPILVTIAVIVLGLAISIWISLRDGSARPMGGFSLLAVWITCSVIFPSMLLASIIVAALTVVLFLLGMFVDDRWGIAALIVALVGKVIAGLLGWLFATVLAVPIGVILLVLLAFGVIIFVITRRARMSQVRTAQAAPTH